METLKPCECGGTGEMQYHCGVFFVRCGTCGDEGPMSWNDDEARSGWNKQVEIRTRPASPPSELVEELRKQVDYDRSYGRKLTPISIDLADRILTALATAPGDGWRSDMENAPKDGSVFWAYQPPTMTYPNGWQYECVWNGDYWYHGFGDAFPEATPTHWRLLPTPPAAGGEDE